jgi:hypothetical protein
MGRQMLKTNVNDFSDVPNSPVSVIIVTTKTCELRMRVSVGCYNLKTISSQMVSNGRALPV